jgi:hypothetical protein
MKRLLLVAAVLVATLMSATVASAWVLPRLDVNPYTTSANAGPYKIRPTSTLISMNGGIVLTHLLWTKWDATTSAVANGEEGEGTGQWNGDQRVMAYTAVHVTVSAPIASAGGPIFAVMTITPLLPPADTDAHLSRQVLDVSGVRS